MPGDLPARRLSSQELEAVIRRAVELQAATEGGDQGITEGEVFRVGKELGLAPELVRRALADVRARPVEERGLVAGVMGPAVVRAVRTVRRPAAEVGLLLDQYLLRCEYMVVLRRFSDRTRYVRAGGVGAAVGRAAYRVGARHSALGLPQLDVAVSAVDDDSALVELSAELRGVRNGLAAGGVSAGGGVAAVVAAFALATPAADLLALAGLPALAAGVAGFRGIYRGAARSRQEKLESLLDRLEHGELRVPAAQGPWRKQLGI